MHDAAQFQASFGAALADADLATDPDLQRALRIHRNTAARAALDALADNFPVLRALAGDDAFAAAAADFFDAAPPDEPRLCLYGAGFSDFLAQYPPFGDYPYLADVAAVERMVVEALFAADADPAGADLMIDLDKPLNLHPALRFARFGAPGAALWLAHQGDDPAAALEHLVWRPEAVVVSRPHGTILVSGLLPEAADFLAACARREPLGQAAALCGDQIAEVFAALVAQGCFV